MSHYGRIVLLVLITIGCSPDNSSTVDDDVLAQINGHSVSVLHFENAFKESYFRTGQVLTPTESTRKVILDSEFNTYVMAVYAKDLELDKSPEAVYQKSAIVKRVLTEEYFEQVIIADLEVSDEDLKDYFIRFNSSLRASHIYANTREEVDEYYTRLQNGESFDDLAKEAFINPYMAQNGGDIGRFTTDELDIAFENQAFSMAVGEISEPIQTAQGFSIIKLTDRVTRPLITEYEFNQNRGRLSSYVRGKKEELARRNHLENFNSSVIFDLDVFYELYSLISSNYDQLLNKNPEFITQLDLNTNVLNFESFDFSTDKLQEELLSSSLAMLNTIQDEYTFRNFIVGVAYRSFMVSEALKLGIDKQDEIEASIEETYLHYLEKLAMQDLASSINNTEEELYTFYQEKQHEFYQSAEIRVQRLAVLGEETANKMYEELSSGADFTTYVIEHTRINDDLFTEGDLGFIPVDDFGFNSEKVSSIEIGGLTEPILYTADEYHIYKILDKKEARKLTFEEAKERVDSFLLREKLQQKRTETIEVVKNKHNAVVDLEKLNALTIKI
ncbi:MAG: peptidylprolyl isomerase [Balneolaceae bacterium]